MITDEMVLKALDTWDAQPLEASGDEAMRAALTAALGDASWQDISTAPKDGTRVLVQLKSPIPNDRDDLRIWDGVPFIARHNGVAKDGFDIGWQFAAPVGCGGWPDDWLIGWQPLPTPAAHPRHDLCSHTGDTK